MGVVPLSGDLEHCRQLVCKPDSLLSVSQRFSRSSIRNKLLIYRAFIHELGTIPYRVSDPGVATAKLAWWHNELKPEVVETSEHPVARAMNQSGNLASIRGDSLDGYFSALMRLGTGEALTSLQDLENTAEQIGGAESVMESGLVDSSSNPESARPLGTGAFISRLFSQPETMFCAQSWWLPLDTRARHAVNFSEGEEFVYSERMQSALQEVSALAVSLLRRGKSEVLEGRKRSELTAGEHHLLIEAEILMRRIALSASSRNAIPVQATVGPREVYFAWREAIRR